MPTRRRHDHSEQVLLRELSASRRSRSLVSVAKQLSRTSRNPYKLARFAEAAGVVMPAGPYVRARLWGSVAALVAPEGFLNGAREKFVTVCDRANVGREEARKWVHLGRVLETLESTTNWNPGGLLYAPRQVFANASRQRSRAGKYLRFANKLLRKHPRITDREIHTAWCKTNGSQKANLDIIKPSDWWAFSRPKWRRDTDFPGSIPGEVYANALYYFAPKRGVAADPMAGSGMLGRVYRDRRLWEKDSAFKLKVLLSDIDPRRPSIRRHDARKPLKARADWIFLDPPYYGQSDHLYEGGLARARTYRGYVKQLAKVIRAMADSLNPGGRLCLLLPKWSGKGARDVNHDLPGDARQLATEVGLKWLDSAYVSRGRQQERGFGYQNIAAKRARRLVSDTCVLTVFEKRRGWVR